MQSIEMSYRDLFNAIILQAVNDYRNALRGIGYGRYSPEKVVEECEQFFRSSYYGMLTKIDGEYLILRLKQEKEGEECESN